MPMPPTLLGPCCLSGTNDNATTPNKCLPGESGVASCHDVAPNGPGNCAPCPGTPGSDCSRCDQVQKVVPGRYKKGPAFPAPCEGCEGVDWNGYAVKDIVEIPKDLAPGRYILGCVPLRSLSQDQPLKLTSWCVAGSATTARRPPRYSFVCFCITHVLDTNNRRLRLALVFANHRSGQTVRTSLSCEFELLGENGRNN